MNNYTPVHSVGDWRQIISGLIFLLVALLLVKVFNI